MVEVSGRKTVCTTDVVFVLNQLGNPIYVNMMTESHQLGDSLTGYNRVLAKEADDVKFPAKAFSAYKATGLSHSGVGGTHYLIPIGLGHCIEPEVMQSERDGVEGMLGVLGAFERMTCRCPMQT